jgi:hypothetical protein
MRLNAATIVAPLGRSVKLDSSGTIRGDDDALELGRWLLERDRTRWIAGYGRRSQLHSGAKHHVDGRLGGHHVG